MQLGNNSPQDIVKPFLPLCSADDYKGGSHDLGIVVDADQPFDTVFNGLSSLSHLKVLYLVNTDWSTGDLWEPLSVLVTLESLFINMHSLKAQDCQSVSKLSEQFAIKDSLYIVGTTLKGC